MKPCQDVSLAGRRAGMTEGTRSNLWGAMRTAIETIQPRYVIAENVRGLLSAKATSDSDMEPGQGPLGNDGAPNLRALGRVLGDLADLGYVGQWYGLRAADIGAPHGRFRVFILAERGDLVPDPRSGRRNETIQRDGGSAQAHDRSGLPDEPDSEPHGPGPDGGWGPYAPAVRRWEQVLGRRAPAPTELTVKGKHRLSARFAEWLMGLPDGWVTDTDISRNEQLKALGNGVVPAQAATALLRMLSAENRMEETA